MIGDGFLEEWLDRILAENENGEISAKAILDAIPKGDIAAKKAIARLFMTEEELGLLSLMEKHRISIGEGLADRAYAPYGGPCSGCPYKGEFGDGCSFCLNNPWRMTCR